MTDDRRAVPWHAWWVREADRAVTRLLLNAWDPIGVAEEPAAANEYASYAPAVGALLRDGHNASTIAAYLRGVRTKDMGLPGDDTADEAVAFALLDWYAKQNV